MSTDLSRLKDGETAQVLSIEADEALHHRLMALGFRIGNPVTVIRHGRFRGPLQVRVGMTDVILRRSDAAKIRLAPA
ncbi:MAG: ferrous iron transport protein A [Methylococcaceae bacterium]|nr:ferrous iron transport protein A [Methylococcaceae bacterium]